MENRSGTGQYTVKQLRKTIPAVVLVILVTIPTFFPLWIERWYSNSTYQYISRFQRIITGWIPFSIGDLLYLLAGIWAARLIFRFFRALIRKQVNSTRLIGWLFRVLRFIAWVYIIFNLAWGWNYHRPGPERQFQFSPVTYSAASVKDLINEIILKLNENRRLLSNDTLLPEPGSKEMTASAVASFQSAKEKWPFLAYSSPSVKPSMYSFIAQYFGFGGYYNPFTGEAQLRTLLPGVMKPFILCHEIGHQVGWAKENEASFAGFMAATVSKDPYTRYSAWLDLYGSARQKLLYLSFEEKDTTVISVLQDYNKQLDTLVRYDRKEIRNYFRKRNNAFSDQTSSLVMGMYEQYLKANQQSGGLRSYDDVVSLVIAYRRKYGGIH